MTLAAALFDLDDTLIVSYANPGPAWRNVVTEFAHVIGADRVGQVGDALAEEMAAFLGDDENRRLWRLKAEATRRAAVEEALSRRGFSSIAEQGGSIADRYAAYREEHMALNPCAHEVLDHYRSRGVKLGLVTNGATDVQRMKIARFDLEDRFDHIQIEEEAGFGKPDGRAYVRTLEALAVPAARAQMTGDDNHLGCGGSATPGHPSHMVQSLWHCPSHRAVTPAYVNSSIARAHARRRGDAFRWLRCRICTAAAGRSVHRDEPD